MSWYHSSLSLVNDFLWKSFCLLGQVIGKTYVLEESRRKQHEELVEKTVEEKVIAFEESLEVETGAPDLCIQSYASRISGSAGSQGHS